MTHGGKLYQLHTHASYGQFSPTSGTGVHYWTDLGTCVSCSVGSASSSPSVAKDNAMTNITHATSGVTGITSSSGLPSGVTASYSSDVLTISGTPTATGTFNYTIDLDGCGDDATGTITVTSCAGTASSSPAVALNAAMTNITHTTTGVSGITSSSGLPSGVSSSYSSNTLTISGTPTATGTFNYTIDLTGCSDDATGTITVFAPPGGVSDDLHLWLKADAQTFSDAGSTASTDGTEVQEWHDQSGNSFDATDNGGTGPDWDKDALNFNPGIDFVSASSEDLEIANGILESENKSSLFHYYVLKVDESQNNGLFRENLGGSNYYEALFWASGSWYGSYGNNVNGEGRIVQNWGANHGEWHLWGWGTSNSLLTPTSTRRYLMRDNTVIDSDNSNTNVGGTGQNNTFYLGSRAAGSYLDGTLCELIIYDGVPTETEEDQIQTYLAVKYGLTLAGEDYMHSDGSTVIWDYSSYTAYHNGIAGIGRDDNSGLHQKQSKSTNYGTVLTMSTEAIAATNTANGTSLTDGTYLLWGHNNSNSSGYADLPTSGGYTGRLQKEWVVEMTGTVSNIHVEFDLSDAHLNLAGDAASDFYLLTDADGDFTSGATATAASSFSGNKVTFDDFNFSDGQYFTLATKQSAPGGIASGLHLWYNASTQSHNTGTTQATDGQDVNNWHDQSGNNFDANSNQGDASYHENGMNFNPTLTFDGTGENYTVSGGIIGDDDTLHNMFVYFAGTVASTGNGRTVFNENTLNHTSDDYEIYMNRSSTANLVLDKGQHTTGTGRISGTFGETVDQPHIVTACAGETTSTPQGTNKYITRDNTVVDTQDGTSNAEGNGTAFYLGSNDANGNDWDGNMSELIILNTIPTATEEDQIQSYLAVKYGITLASMNYLSSSGTVIWNNSTYSSYHYDIAGIGRDDLSGLHQKQSKSANSDAIVTMSTEAIGTTNAGISTSLTDGAYLLWGNNNSTSNAYDDIPAGYSGRLKKEWVVEMTGTVADVHVEFDITDHDYMAGDAAADFYLLVDADGDFTSGASATVASSFGSNKVTFNDIVFTDGQYFTLATQETGPGGVSSNLRLWLKADAGTNTTTEDADVTSWTDQSLKGFDADDSYSGHNGPDYKANAINYNPALDFDGSNEGLRLTGAIIDVSRDAYFFYLVSQRDDDDSGVRNVFRVTANSSKYLWFRHKGTGANGADFCYGNTTDGQGRIDGTPDNATVQPYLWSFGAHATSNATPNGTRRYIQQNNTTIASNNASSNVRADHASNLMFIGTNPAGNEDYDGLIAEIICLDDIPTDEEDLRIKSYLALKYGITMASMDYKVSGGTQIWDKDANASYNNDISGIGRDDLSGFNQKQSKSLNSDAIVTMSTQAIAANNAANTTQLGTDASFEMWANNGGSVAMQTSELHTDFTERLGREWLVQESGTVGNVVVEVDLTGVSFSNTHVKNFALVIDDDGTFTGGTQSWVGASTYSSNKVTFDAVDFSDGKYFTVMNTPNALPVELTYFEAKRTGSYVLLEWETMAEVNNDYFIVEKSTDGENWTELLTVDGQGNSSEPTYYSQIDIDGCDGVCYYRLIQVDFGGERKEEKIVALNSDGYNTELKISVSPNPINQMANIAFTAPESGMFSLTVTTQTGKVIYTAKTIGDKGNNHISYNASRLSSGSYYFILEDENGNRTQQLVIK